MIRVFGETGRELKVQNIDNFNPAGWDMALFAIGSEATKIHAPQAPPRRAAS